MISNLVALFLKYISIALLITVLSLSNHGCLPQDDSSIEAGNSVIEQRLKIEPQNSIVFLGNTFIDRMQLFGYFESFLHCKFPTHKLKIRNMGWPADEVALRPRPEGFYDMHSYLEEEKADIIFTCYGLNESFNGLDSLQVFTINLRDWLNDLRGHRYNGKGAPQIALISPIAYEALDHLPDGLEMNERLRIYTEAMREVAKELDLIFIDLFTPTLSYFQESEGARLTFNGIHLNAFGDWWVSHTITKALFDKNDIPEVLSHDHEEGAVIYHKLRRAIYDKNYSYSIYWRGPNMEYIYGSRSDAPGANRMVEERYQLGEVITQQDELIWNTEKPSADAIWHYFHEGRPLWASTPSYEEVQVPTLSPSTLREELRGDDKSGQILDIEKALHALDLPEGYEINLFASEKDFPLANPMAMNFDHRGRLWVANTPTWPHPLPGEQPQDFIVILEDADQDGYADKHTVFMDHLNLIHGFALGNGGAFISQTPYLIFAKDTDGDDVADAYESVLQGFGAEDAEHAINNLTWGPDGGLYFMNGIFFHSQVETPYGPIRMKDSGVFRYDWRRNKLDSYLSHFFWNPWGLVFDVTGQGILLDASSGDLYHMTPMASNFKYPKRKHNYDSFESAVADPSEKVMHELLSFAPEGIGSAAGIGIIANSHFPEEAQGRLLSNQIEGWRGTHWFDMKADGTIYELGSLNRELLFSEDPYFRPVAITFGIDGALYILDFYSPIFENVEFPKRSKGRDHSHGRIWRITYPSRPLLEIPKFAEEPTMQLLDLLKSRESPHRYFARRELQERDPARVLGDLKSWVKSLNRNDGQYEQFGLEALWIYQGLDVVNEALLKQLLRAQAPKIRSAAARILRFWQGRIDDSSQLLKRLVNDEDMRVRLEAVIACGYSLSPEAYETAEQAADYAMDDGMEHALRETLLFLEERNTSREENLQFISTDDLLSLPMSEAVGHEWMIRRDPQVNQTHRKEACRYLAQLKQTSMVTELIKVLNHIEDSSNQQKLGRDPDPVLVDLITILLESSRADLMMERDQLLMVAKSSKLPSIRGGAFLALSIADQDISASWRLAQNSDADLISLIDGIKLISNDEFKKRFYRKVADLLKDASIEQRQSAIHALADIPVNYGETFEMLHAISSNVSETITIRFAALNGLENLSKTKVRDRTKVTFIQKIEIASVTGKMKYDKEELSVLAGSAVEITFKNKDLMQHNLLICMPDQLELVGKVADEMSVQPDAVSRHFIPDINAILFSTPMISPGESFTLQFFAPNAPGEYPYVCTFPGHWRVMNGVMNVLESEAL